MTKSCTKRSLILVAIFLLCAFTTGVHANTARKPELPDLREHDIGSTKRGEHAQKQLGTTDLPLVIRAIQEEKTEDQIRRDESERRSKTWTDWIGAISAGVTAMFTIVLGLFTIALARETRRLRCLADKQAEDAKVALAITKRSADAAIALERPILVIEKISMSPKGGQPQIVFGNHGRTPATITQDCLVTQWSKDVPPEPVYQPSTEVPTLSPRVVDAKEFYDVTRNAGPSYDQWQTALADKETLLAYGYVEYFDFLKERRRTGFCLRFVPVHSPMYPSANCTDGDWILGGPPAYTYDKLVN